MLCSKSVVLRLGINRSPTPLLFLQIWYWNDLEQDQEEQVCRHLLILPTLPRVGVFALRAGDLLLQLVLVVVGATKDSPTRHADRDLGIYLKLCLLHENLRIEPVESSSRYIEPGDVWFERLASDCGAHTDGGIHTNLHEFKIA